MRDRIKFRAWDKENKKYIYGVEKGLQFYSTVGNLRVMTLSEIEESDKYDLEQCTGMRDKNGKLIYEGDVLPDSYKKGETAVVWFDKKTLGFNCGCHVLFGYKHEKELEIIGNIHEKITFK